MNGRNAGPRARTKKVRDECELLFELLVRVQFEPDGSRSEARLDQHFSKRASECPEWSGTIAQLKNCRNANRRWKSVLIVQPADFAVPPARAHRSVDAFGSI